MKLLLDSHALIWSVCDPSSISSRAQECLQDPENNVYFSAVSLWEIALKFAMGKLILKGITPEDLRQAGIEMGFSELSLAPQIAAGFHQLSRESHKDPFDRMLVWQAISGGYWLVSKDEGLAAYVKQGLNVLW